jgi:hypothetical protein
MGAALKRRLSFANVVALIALFVALGGSVYAANKISGKTIKKGSEPGNRLKKNSVTGKQVNESSLGAVPSANSAQSAQPVAFAEISETGAVDPTHSKGVSSANVTKKGPGVFCISGLSFPIKGAQVTPIFFATNGTTANFTPEPTGNCPDGGQVLIFDSAGGGTDTPFNIVLYG